MPVKTVSRRLGISTVTSFRLFSRAPWTRIRSWLSAECLLEEAMFAIMPSTAIRRRDVPAGADSHVTFRSPIPSHRGDWRSDVFRWVLRKGIHKFVTDLLAAAMVAGFGLAASAAAQVSERPAAASVSGLTPERTAA